MSFSVYILVYRDTGSMELCCLYGSLELILRWLHKRRVECTTHREDERTLSACCLQLLTRLVYSILMARYSQLSRVIVVCWDNDIAIL